MMLTEWREEHNRLTNCANDIAKTMESSYTDNSLKNMTFDELIRKHGIDRINQAFASTILENEHDGRIRRELKEWAKHIEILPPYSDSKTYYYEINAHQGLIDIAAQKFVNIQKELPIIENDNGYQYQVLMQERDFALLNRMGDHPEFYVAFGLKEQNDGKFQWDSGVYFKNWDNAVSYYVDGVVDKKSEMKRQETPVTPSEETEETPDFEDENEDEIEI